MDLAVRQGKYFQMKKMLQGHLFLVGSQGPLSGVDRQRIDLLGGWKTCGHGCVPEKGFDLPPATVFHRSG
jgi:hypothetical protein